MRLIKVIAILPFFLLLTITGINISIGSIIRFGVEPGLAAPGSLPCPQPGWHPDEIGLKDHSVFWFDGYYYLVSIYLPDERQFAYARSLDLCNWETLPVVLGERIPGSWDEQDIWAPFVYEESGVYYLYYTGVTNEYTQSILLATSTDPYDTQAWQPQGVVFQPNHPGMVWQPGTWSDCRDATVIKVNGIYTMVYTGRDQAGAIIGLATATSPSGPWQDWGAIVDFTESQAVTGESPTLFLHDGLYYLFYNNVVVGEEYRISTSLAGPWEEPYRFQPGWAHEIWEGRDGLDYTSYLIGYSVNISQVTWDDWFDPPRPIIGERVNRAFLPIAQR